MIAWFFKTATEQPWTNASVLSLSLSSDNLLKLGFHDGIVWYNVF